MKGLGFPQNKNAHFRARAGRMTRSSLWSDLSQWLKAIVHHWIAIAGGAAVAVIFLIASIWVGGDWLRFLSVLALFGSFVCATFLAWRDEHAKTIGKERRSILNNVVDFLRPKVTVLGSERPDEICALIEVSDDFGSEEDVAWVSQQLDEHSHIDPFAILGTMLEPGFDGKRLKFLQDARVQSPPISSMSDALRYAHLWASSNGLARKDLMPTGK
jgi:hypothetical protein